MPPFLLTILFGSLRIQMFPGFERSIFSGEESISVRLIDQKYTNCAQTVWENNRRISIFMGAQITVTTNWVVKNLISTNSYFGKKHLMSSIPKRNSGTQQVCNELLTPKVLVECTSRSNLWKLKGGCIESSVVSISFLLS